MRETIWLEIKKHLVIRGKSVLLEMVLKTQADHFNPLISTVTSAQKHLDDSSVELRDKGEATLDYSVRLKVINLFADLAVLEERIRRRQVQIAQHGNITGTNVFDLSSFSAKSGVDIFELPPISECLYLDTSNQSEQSVDSNLQEIVSYVLQDQLPLDQDKRRAKAEKGLRDLKKLVGI